MAKGKGKPKKKISDEAQKLLDRKNEKKREKQELTTRTNERNAFIRKYADIIEKCNQQPDLLNAMRTYSMQYEVVDNKTRVEIIMYTRHADEYTQKINRGYNLDLYSYDDYP